MGALPKPMTIEEFIAWEERQDLRYEFDGFVVRATTGGTYARAAIQANLLGALGNHLGGTPCRVFGSQLKVRTNTSVRYPDALITCSRADPQATFARDPVVIFEILSKSTARDDLGVKNAEYQAISSLKRYVVLHQSLAAAEVFHRDAEGEWTYEFISADGALQMPEVGVSIPLAELYEGVELAS
jgi:Uma2 family endonuclease